VHTDVGNRCVAAKIDRRHVPLKTALTSGDTIEIITSRDARPDPSWVEHVVTAKARNGIRATLKRLQQSEARRLGQQLLSQTLRPYSSTPLMFRPSRLDGALRGLDFMDAVDIYVNETTRHADVILPPTVALERDHYDLVFHLLAVRNTARFTPAVFDKEADQRHDWQILLELEKRLVKKPTPAQRVWRMVASRGPHVLLDLALRSGPYGKGPLSFVLPFGKGLTLKQLKRNPHGVDLGALKPCLPARLRTEDRRIHLAPAVLVEDVDRLRRRGAEIAADASSPNGTLTLIGRRQVRSNHSWMHNYPRLMKGADRCTLL